MSSQKEIAIDLAIRVGKLILDRFQIGGTPATLKADRSFVTEVDLAADRLIQQTIDQSGVGEHLLSEESQHCVESLEPAIWVVDPLDGTTNYSLGLHVWGVSIARLVQGYPVMGVIYFPLLNELYFAEKGRGASCNGAHIHTQPPDIKHPMSFFACCSRTHRRYSISIPYKSRILGSAAYSFCMLARGTACVSFEAAPKIWDIAATWLLVQEAGGTISPHLGATPFPISPMIDYASIEFPTLAAASQELFNKCVPKIQPKSFGQDSQRE